MSEASSSKQIRPKIRGRAPKPSSTTTSISLNDGVNVEETRKRMENWMGLNESSVVSNSTKAQEVMDVPTEIPDSDVSEKIPRQDKPDQPTKSILRTPKYTKVHVNEDEASGHNKEKDETIVKEMKTSGEEARTKQNVQRQDPPVETPESTFVCKDFVIERDPTKPMRKRKVKPRSTSDPSAHSIVEGYIPLLDSKLSRPTPSEIVAPSTQVVDSVNMTPAPIETVPKSASLAGTEIDDDTSAKVDESNPLILNSMEELFEAAGESPSSTSESQDRNRITAETKLLEADIAFSVMTQEQYDGRLTEIREQHEEERQAQLKVFTGIENIFDDDDKETDDDEEGSGKGSENEDDDDDDDDDDMMEMLMARDELDEEGYFQDHALEEVEEVRQPRVFRLLWDTLAEWFTPEAAQYLSYLIATFTSGSADGSSSSSGMTWKPPVIARSDIEASRCAGLMAMIKLYLPSILQELAFPQELRRTADIRLGELLRSFNYVLEAPKLPVKLWKTMTCILLELVLVERQKDEMLTIPPSAAAVGMTMDEYRYLSRSAVKNFGVMGA